MIGVGGANSWVSSYEQPSQQNVPSTPIPAHYTVDPQQPYVSTPLTNHVPQQQQYVPQSGYGSSAASVSHISHAHVQGMNQGQGINPYQFHQQVNLHQRQQQFEQQRGMNDGVDNTPFLPPIGAPNGGNQMNPQPGTILGNGGGGGGGAQSVITKKNAHASILMPDVYDGPLQIAIHGISAVELPSIHTFGTNSPCCSIACGKYSNATEVRDYDCFYALLLIPDSNSQLDQRECWKCSYLGKLRFPILV